MERGVAPAVLLVDICSSEKKDLNKRMVVVDGGKLKGIVAVLGVDGIVDGEVGLEEVDHLGEVVGGDGSEHAVALGVGVDSCVVVVPADEDLEVGCGHEHERIGGESWKFRKPLIYGEGQPLAGAENGGPG